MAKKNNSIGSGFIQEVIDKFGVAKIIGITGLGIVSATIGMGLGIIFIPNEGEKYIKVKINKEEK